MELRPNRPSTESAPRILFIDDEPELRELMLELLSHYRLETANSGATGVKAFRDARADGDPFDLIISDLGMPFVDGRDVASAIKAESPQTPILLLTGWGNLMDKPSIPDHVDKLLGKPVEPEVLLATVSELIR